MLSHKKPKLANIVKLHKLNSSGQHIDLPFPSTKKILQVQPDSKDFKLT